MSHTYDDSSRGSGANSVKWNGIALAGRQLIIVVFSLVLARMLGPGDYGVVAQATVYTAFLTLVLDQGISAALLSRKSVDTELLRVSVTVNVGLGMLFAALTVPLAPFVAAFMNTPPLTQVLPVLAIAIVMKGAQVVPRILLTRWFRFKALAIAETSSALAGGVLGVVAAAVGMEYWSIVVQLVATDVILTMLLLATAKSPGPGFALKRLGEIVGFSTRVLGSNILSFGSRNVDTVLIAKFLGETQVGLYSLAYRVLLLPIQMVSQTVSRVVFPIIARDREDRPRVSATLQRSVQAIALITFPVMALIGTAAYDGILVFLGESWLPAAPVIALLALTGARQSVTALNSPTMLGFGRADIQLKFLTLASIVQIGGMVAGLPFGIVGVAAGYTLAGILLMPVIFAIQRQLAGTSVRAQLHVLLAPLHAALWSGAVYGTLYLAPISPGARLVIGGALALVVYVLVLRLVHKKVFLAACNEISAVVHRRR